MRCMVNVALPHQITHDAFTTKSIFFTIVIFRRQFCIAGHMAETLVVRHRRGAKVDNTLSPTFLGILRKILHRGWDDDVCRMRDDVAMTCDRGT